MSLLDTIRDAAKVMRKAAPPPLTIPRAPPARPSAGPGELARVLALPRRQTPAPETLSMLAAAWGTRLRRPGGTQELRPAQAWMLEEMAAQQGLLGAIGIGHGKTLPDILAPLAVPGCKVAVLLIPPELRPQFFKHDWDFYGAHWQRPNLAGGDAFVAGRPMLHVMAYSELSAPSFTERLDRLAPDLIIADECQCLSNCDTVRTGRFLRYLAAHPGTRFCGWSGTILKRSILNFAHQLIFALRERAPVPLVWAEVEAWAAILDPSDIPAPAGPLRALDTGGGLHKGFHRRLVETPGVVSLAAQSTDVPLVIRPRALGRAIPPTVTAALDTLKRDWVRPDGEEFDSGLKVSACARQLACGFFYRWKFPRGEPEALIEHWFKCRKEWKRELRAKVLGGGAHMDSPALCRNAAARFYDGYKGELPVWEARTWQAWEEVKDRVYHETEACWIDDFLARDAAVWASENVGIVWYEHEAFGARVAEISKAPRYGGGEAASTNILREKGDRTIIVGTRAHSTGKNLQMFHKQLVANPPSDGGVWEQMLGRTHRSGQLAEEVLVEIYRHVEEMVAAVDKAHSLAQFIETITGAAQRLNHASGLLSGKGA